MKNKNCIVGLALFTLIGGAAVSLAADYTGWQNEYDGTETATRYLWNYDDGQYNSANAFNMEDDGTPNPRAYLYGDATFGVLGKFGKGASLTGATGDTLYADINDLTNGSSLTVETWVKFDTFGTYNILADKMRNVNAGYKLQYNKDQYGDRLVFFIGDGSAQRFVSGTKSLDTNRWYHLAGTWDNATSTVKVFVDGVEINSKTFSGSSFVDSTKNLFMGSREYYKDYTVNGTMDGFRISDTAIDFAVPPTTVKVLSIPKQN